MRLVTRSDFDGLVCAVLLEEAGLVDSYCFVEPKEVQDGDIDIRPDDILANLPYSPGAGMWFDHHASEAVRLRENGDIRQVKGLVKRAPSCARVVWDYFEGEKRFPPRLHPLVEAADKVDSAHLSREEIENPEGYVLLGFVVDPRSGLEQCCRFARKKEDFLPELVTILRNEPVAKALAQPDIKERLTHYFSATERFRQMLKDNAVLQSKVLILDLRFVPEVHAGNRFLVYTLFPEASVSVMVNYEDQAHETVVFSVGHSIVNRGCRTNVGQLLLGYGGGGHVRVGTCKVPSQVADQTLKELVERLRREC